jgi:DNA-binding response OmpR family regulator
MTMDEQLRRVLILDIDPGTFITLQHVLEHAEIDTTITWDETEARQLLETEPFGLLLIGDHPPELDAVSVLSHLRFQCASLPSLILREAVRENDIEHFRGLGAIGVVSMREPLAVLEQVTRALAPMLFRAKSPKTGLAEARSWRAAS